jgi:fructosamine-3-kinase
MDLKFQQHIATKINRKLNRNLRFYWQSVGGGSINTTHKISSENFNYFVKTNTTSVFKNGFKEEVLGLQFLKKQGAIVPKIIIEGAFNNHIYLVLAWIDEGIKIEKFWKNFAFHLANLHQQSAEQFGLEYPNFMGELPQKNTFYNDFSTFFIENRLKPQVKLAFNKGFLQTKQLSQFENLYKQLPSIFPIEKPSAVHGDLWSGNYICSQNNKVVFIDPAVYYGHREIDLAMSMLFGGFSLEFYNTYQEIYTLEKGFNSRKDIYNLYPLLIHLNLFGNSYFKNIETIVSKF